MNFSKNQKKKNQKRISLSDADLNAALGPLRSSHLVQFRCGFLPWGRREGGLFWEWNKLGSFFSLQKMMYPHSEDLPSFEKHLLFREKIPKRSQFSNVRKYDQKKMMFVRWLFEKKKKSMHSSFLQKGKRRRESVPPNPPSPLKAKLTPLLIIFFVFPRIGKLLQSSWCFLN